MKERCDTDAKSHDSGFQTFNDVGECVWKKVTTLMGKEGLRCAVFVFLCLTDMTINTPLDDIFRTRCLRRACGILKDETHPANHLFTLLPSGRRYRATTARTSRLQNSFIPRAITELNNHTTLIPSTQHNCTFFSGCTNKFRCVSNAQ